MSPIRFDSLAQIERIRKAAKLKKWSFNQFVVDAAENAAILETQKISEQLMVERNLPSLNQ